MMTSVTAIASILLIDDDADDCLVFEDALHCIDSNIELTFINSYKDIPPPGKCKLPDLIFLDINMPDKNGFEWLNDIKNARHMVPVIMYSTASNPLYVKRAYEEGAHIYFPKPESFKKLQESLRKLLDYNWTEPEKIRKHFIEAGEFKVFAL